jgi:hypothetical protein
MLSAPHDGRAAIYRRKRLVELPFVNSVYVRIESPQNKAFSKQLVLVLQSMDCGFQTVDSLKL